MPCTLNHMATVGAHLPLAHHLGLLGLVEKRIKSIYMQTNVNEASKYLNF